MRIVNESRKTQIAFFDNKTVLFGYEAPLISYKIEMVLVIFGFALIYCNELLHLERTK